LPSAGCERTVGNLSTVIPFTSAPGEPWQPVRGIGRPVVGSRHV